MNDEEFIAIDHEARLAEDPGIDPHHLLVVAQVYPEKALQNPSLLLLHFVDLDLANAIHGTARGVLAAEGLGALAEGCGPRVLALFALQVARRAVGRWDERLPRPGRVLRALDLVEQHVRVPGPSLELGQQVERLGWGVGLGGLPDEAQAAWRAVKAALEAGLARRAGLTRRAALEAAEHGAAALAGEDELAHAEERERQVQELAALREEFGAL